VSCLLLDLHSGYAEVVLGLTIEGVF